MRHRILKLFLLSALLGIVSLAIWSDFCASSEVPAAAGWVFSGSWTSMVELSASWPAHVHDLMGCAIWLFILRSVCDHWLQWVSAAFLILLSADFAGNKLIRTMPGIYSTLHKYSVIGGATLIVCSIGPATSLICLSDIDMMRWGAAWFCCLPFSLASTILFTGIWGCFMIWLESATSEEVTRSSRQRRPTQTEGGVEFSGISLPSRIRPNRLIHRRAKRFEPLCPTGH